MTEYKIPLDAFAVEELRRLYQSVDARGRIALLQSDTLPFEIARLAVEDPNAEVRQFFARHGRDYRELLRDAGGGFRFSERDLLEILRKDSDPFVRACVYANPAFKPLLNVITAGPGEALGAMAGIGMLTKKWWSEATHLERLGMVRNREFSSCMLEELKSNELGLSSEQRKELIWAFLAARDEVRDRESNDLWKVLAELPEETDRQALVYRFLPVDDHTAAEVYRKTGNPEWRRAILQMVWDEDVMERSAERYGLHNETLDLAIKDANGVCRLLAYATLRLGHSNFADRRGRSKHWQDLQRAARSDIYALSGLAKNPALTPDELRWVETSANALVGSLKDESNLWVHLGGDEGYSTSEVGLLHQIRHDVECRITELRFEKQVGKLSSGDKDRPPSHSKLEGTQEGRLDYLTLVSISTATFGLREVFSVTGPALIIFALTYLLSDNLALALFALLLSSWLRRKVWLFWRPSPVEPWLYPDVYQGFVKEYWSQRLEPRKPPLIQERPAGEVEREAQVQERRQQLRERFGKFRDESWRRLEAHKRDRDAFARKAQRSWYLLKRKLRVLTRS
jgi:hypothetical protein